ncbi:hypothetical protein [Collinsella intestinalis]|uniref:hypothetical protein n=1 Tax=Collinsella intestinalis TaxID=147207 RepID=UPI001956BEA7|nr:hypothetical protein [Collinsella intestinalis]
MRDLLAGYLDLLIRNSPDGRQWKTRFSSLAERKASGKHGDTYRKAKKALDADFDGFSTKDMDVTLLCALLIFDMNPNGDPLLSGVKINSKIRSWIFTLRNDRNDFHSHEDAPDGWRSWKRAIACLCDMERFLDEVEEAYRPSREYQDYVKAGRQALEDEESIFQRVYDEERLPSVQDIEIEQTADRIMGSPDRLQAYLREEDRLRGNDFSLFEKRHKLFRALADRGLPLAKENLGSAYFDGLIQNGRQLPPDYRSAASCFLSVGIESLQFHHLRELACIMADPAKRPEEYGEKRCRELYDGCTAAANRKGWAKRGWPEFEDGDGSDA